MKIWTLLLKEFTIEFRNKSVVGSLVLYVIATVFLIYITLAQQGAEKDLEVKHWNIFMWMVALFSAVNAVARSFTQDEGGRFYYYYYMCKPEWIIGAKLMYNGLLMIVLVSLTFIAMSLMLGNPVKNMWILWLVMFLGGCSFSFLFALISAIAVKSGSASTMTAILGFPLIIPLMIFLMKLSREAFFEVPSENFLINLGILSIWCVMLVLLSLILFPYLWRD